MTRTASLALLLAVSPAAAHASTRLEALAAAMPAVPAAPSTPWRVAERPRVCQPGISRCGADGYVERCDADGTHWTGSMLHCH